MSCICMPKSTRWRKVFLRLRCPSGLSWKTPKGPSGEEWLNDEDIRCVSIQLGDLSSARQSERPSQRHSERQLWSCKYQQKEKNTGDNDKWRVFSRRNHSHVTKTISTALRFWCFSGPSCLLRLWAGFQRVHKFTGLIEGLEWVSVEFQVFNNHLFRYDLNPWVGRLWTSVYPKTYRKRLNCGILGSIAGLWDQLRAYGLNCGRGTQSRCLDSISTFGLKDWPVP